MIRTYAAQTVQSPFRGLSVAYAPFKETKDTYESCAAPQESSRSQGARSVRLICFHQVPASALERNDDAGSEDQNTHIWSYPECVVL